MSLKSMNIFCFIIILVSTSFFSVATAVDGYIFKSDVEIFRKLLLVNDTTKTDEFSFTFSRDPACKHGTRSSLQVSFGSAKPGASLISFKLDVADVSGQGVATVTSMDDSSIATTDIGNKFVVTFKSLGLFKLQADGKQNVQSSNAAITETLSFDNFNSTHLGIHFYAWFTDTTAQKCSLNFGFPDYDVLKATIVHSSTLPSGEPTLQPVETTNTVLPEKTTTSNICISSTVIYVVDKVGTLLMMILINAVTLYFVLSRFSYSKPPENDNTKIDAEETKTKSTTLQYNIHNYFPNITRNSTRQKLTNVKAEKLTLYAINGDDTSNEINNIQKE